MKKLWDILCRCSVATTAILIVFYLFSTVLPLEDPGINAKAFFLIFAFSALLSVAQELFSIKKLHIAARFALHFASLAVGFILVFILSGNYERGGARSLFVGTVLFSLCYAIIAVPAALIKSKKAAKRSKDQPSTYKKIYG